MARDIPEALKDCSGGVLPDRRSVSRFRSIVTSYYRDHARPFPWREGRDPYRILVSELMLQQTQTERVLPKWHAFIERFPDFPALAGASLREVFGLWQGLGYNRRAKALYDTARIVMERHAGKLPDEVEALEELPGIGPYTARAICAFAFDRPVVLIETNIRRVFIHFFFPEAEAVHDREILPLVELTLDTRRVRDWYYALMDYGVFLRSAARNPNRRSAHYVRQAPFDNSNRQLRGRILAFLAAQGEADRERLLHATGKPEERLSQSLSELEREGLIVMEGAVYRIPDGRNESS